MSLRLETYFFTSIAIEANTEFVKRDAPVDCDVDVSGEIHFIDTSRVGLSVRIAVERSEHFPYEIDLYMFAGAAIEDSMEKFADKGVLDHLLHTHRRSLISICYSAAREFVLLTTGRQPWGPFSLPIIFPQDIELDVKLGPDVQALADKSNKIRKQIESRSTPQRARKVK